MIISSIMNDVDNSHRLDAHAHRGRSASSGIYLTRLIFTLPHCATNDTVPVDDVSKIGADHCTITPTGAAFLHKSLRPGVLPDILQALMSARAATRSTLKTVQKQMQQQQEVLSSSSSTPAAAAATRGTAGQDDSRHAAAEAMRQLKARSAVLDGRQKALKLTANALYGFTGAQASPLQCAPLADSCLALGAATCRTAAAGISEALDKGLLGPKGKGGKVSGG